MTCATCARLRASIATGLATIRTLNDKLAAAERDQVAADAMLKRLRAELAAARFEGKHDTRKGA